MAKRKQIKHKAGAYTFYLKPIPQSVLAMVLSAYDKPPAPVVEVEYAGGVKVMEQNPNDPGYQAELQQWQVAYNARVFRACIRFGIDHVTDAAGNEARPSKEAASAIRFVYGASMPSDDLLFYWYAQILGNTMPGFTNLVLGQTAATEEDVANAEELFRPDGEGAGVDREDQ